MATAPSVQIFGFVDCQDTRKAQRFFAERRVAVHFVDLKRRPAAAGELRRFREKFGAAALVDRQGRRFEELGRLAGAAPRARAHRAAPSPYPARPLRLEARRGPSGGGVATLGGGVLSPGHPAPRGGCRPRRPRAGPTRVAGGGSGIAEDAGQPACPCERRTAVRAEALRRRSGKRGGLRPPGSSRASRWRGASRPRARRRT